LENGFQNTSFEKYENIYFGLNVSEGMFESKIYFGTINLEIKIKFKIGVPEVIPATILAP